MLSPLFSRTCLLEISARNIFIAYSGHLSSFSFATNKDGVVLIPNLYLSVSNPSYLFRSQPVDLRASAGLCRCCLEEAPVTQGCPPAVPGGPSSAQRRDSGPLIEGFA